MKSALTAVRGENNQLNSAGHRKFFLSSQIRNRISMFLIRNRKSAIARLKA